MTATVLNRLTEASGLSQVFGPAAIRRALERAHVSPTTTRLSDVVPALPEIERALAIFMNPAEAQTAMGRIRRLVSG